MELEEIKFTQLFEPHNYQNLINRCQNIKGPVVIVPEKALYKKKAFNCYFINKQKDVSSLPKTPHVKCKFKKKKEKCFIIMIVLEKLYK